MVVAQQVPDHAGVMWVRSVLTIAKLKRWSINYYIDTVATLVGLTDGQRVGGEAHAELVARWLDDGLTPNGPHGRAFGKRRCARLRPDILRAQERLASPGAAHR
jgi:hypothetical protein